ncbi:AAA family ATPase [Microvirga sp. 3-52]|uniref:AAA family ATPase n=1 Tax=Microvirga sp. 3-52 TaxID=2792425 RepID=UPI001AC3A043|nr:AAA family ATPase [Microvirga sp. 3-52]MBO1905297.1 AAA family ATPase [Microvirga sp. 3-52]MBS7452614.1 AAA family ATPase [Microvirga sp. 3-52]
MTVIKIERVLSSKPYGVIVAGRTLDARIVAEGCSLRVKAARTIMLGEPAVGETWDVDGHLVSTRWGPQIDATRASRSLPSGVLITRYLAEQVPGIGPSRADLLWKTYGTALPEVLAAGDLAAIAAIIAPDRPVLGPRLAATLVQAWREADTEARLVAWLQQRGVDDMRVARRIAATFGFASVERLERNPWCLVTLLPWEKVDDLGLRLMREAGATAPDDQPNRLVGAVDAVIKDLIATGATAMEDHDLRVRLAGKLKVGQGHPRLLAALYCGVRNGAILGGDGGTWRAPGCAAMEEAVASRLRAMAERPDLRPRDIGPFDFASALQHYETVNGRLHPEQRAAVLKVLASPFACLQGGAGVGKTHTTKAICALWEAAGGDVLLAALAGKAALRLSRSTGRLARTLFRTLRELEERGAITTRLARGLVEPDERPRLESQLKSLAHISPRSLVLVDEASMVDLATIHALQRFMPAGARLLLVGDECQLPPVGFGLTFHKLVDDPRITARLTVVHRQTDDSGIPAVAGSLRAREMPLLEPYRGIGTGVSLVPANGAAEIADRLIGAYLDLAGEDVLVVAPTNEGPSGVRVLNRRLHDLHLLANDGIEIRGALGELFSVGDPVVHRRNDYKRGLFNGSMGQVIAVDVADGSLIAVFDGEEHTFERDELIDLALGYALTCHRAQGSQAARVIVALTPSRLLDPSWLYTSVTRAERQAVLLGDTLTLAAALRQPWASESRRVGFSWP